MKKFSFKIKGRQYDVEVNDAGNDLLTVDVNGTSYEIEVDKPEATPSKTPTLVRARVDSKPEDAKIKQSAGGGGGSIKAPLPGSIIKINVAQGDTVKVGDTVMVMEAMKMENNIQAEKSGVVKSLKVSVGDTVMQDDVLVELG